MDSYASGDLADMIWSVPEIIANLSTFRLEPGDLIYRHPGGCRPGGGGDVIEAGVDGVGSLSVRIV
jgi:fumarylpyruvate hydrolase